MNPEEKALAALAGRVVVLDTRSPLLYIGTLAGIDDGFIKLEDVDVHDQADSRSTKELYVMTAAQHGVRPNRRRALVRFSEVVSISPLEDVIVY